jgi:glycosyltransferase involved in cell wall biosynthesis
MNDPLRVAMIIQRYYPHVGGAERQVAALAPHLQAQGIALTVLTRRYDRRLPAFERVASVPVYRLPVPGPKALAALSFTATAQWVLARWRPHLIHAHELLSPATVAITAKRLFDVPVVAKVLNGGALGDVAKLQGRPTGQRRLALLQRQVDRFIVISDEIDGELATVGVPASKRVFIPNGVDVAHFHPVTPAERVALRQQLGLPTGPLVLFTGRLTAQKRLDLLLDCWPTLRSQQPHATLLLLGTGDAEATLKARAVPGVRFLAPVDDVAPYLQAADLFVLPSAAEGLSNALLEALATGLPAVATKVGGAGDLIAHGQNGWLIPPNAPAALGEALQRLLADAALRGRLGCAARQSVAEKYALTTVADRLQRLYRHLAAT